MIGRLESGELEIGEPKVVDTGDREEIADLFENASIIEVFNLKGRHSSITTASNIGPNDVKRFLAHRMGIPPMPKDFRMNDCALYSFTDRDYGKVQIFYASSEPLSEEDWENMKKASESEWEALVILSEEEFEDLASERKYALYQGSDHYMRYYLAGRGFYEAPYHFVKAD